LTTPAVLALEDGTVFRGISVGAKGNTTGEVVFNTAMTGYEEILTDPSYSRQIVTLTYPHIGNYGTTPEDLESGAVYAAGGLRRAQRGPPHTHDHTHNGFRFHEHEHVHEGFHAHPHGQKSNASITPWVFFTIFLLGPCEPLIPLIIYPAARHDPFGVATVALVFGAVTLVPMTIAAR